MKAERRTETEENDQQRWGVGMTEGTGRGGMNKDEV